MSWSLFFDRTNCLLFSNNPVLLSLFIIHFVLILLLLLTCLFQFFFLLFFQFTPSLFLLVIGLPGHKSSTCKI